MRSNRVRRKGDEVKYDVIAVRTAYRIKSRFCCQWFDKCNCREKCLNNKCKCKKKKKNILCNLKCYMFILYFATVKKIILWNLPRAPLGTRASEGALYRRLKSDNIKVNFLSGIQQFFHSFMIKFLPFSKLVIEILECVAKSCILYQGRRKGWILRCVDFPWILQLGCQT